MLFKICIIGCMFNVEFKGTFWSKGLFLLINSIYCVFEGNSSGIIQIYNLSSGEVHRELNIHSCTVRYLTI